MQLYYIIENNLMTIIQAPSALSALEHYAITHGWRLPTDVMRFVSQGYWEVFGGEIQVFDHNPQEVLNPPV
ncbi:hypothetical protein [Deinococcus cellulosilyticus]|uniref:Uncharacterized protein n=2 Tax=Deinococcus cellulosilyticus TaxID=401558 RepID=A0A511N1H9_DEIC1|nr:hypothetical protein [Deinococcus cellulosilyticus]GEM46735.1 hypothetical protein DC3_23700 [Deinococcus cellulosilyticus NBRC 106333 = KACC 11606]